MKIRKDYVTNSSSSSFILVFSGKNSFERFKEECEWSNYNEFCELICGLTQEPQKKQKEKAKERLRSYFKYEIYKRKLIEEKFSDSSDKNYIKELAYINSEDFEKRLSELLGNDEDYQNRLKKIEDADLIVCGQIWDTNGGTLEWAIRNGFIESAFRIYSVLVWNVG